MDIMDIRVITVIKDITDIMVIMDIRNYAECPQFFQKGTKEQKNRPNITMIPQVELFSFVFWEN